VTACGGTGAPGVAVASLDPVWSNELALHELGHSAFDLADEYPNWAGCSSGETTQDSYPFGTLGEPVEENVTATLAPLKWNDHVDPATPIPSTSNPDCTQCDPQASPLGAGTAGAFEGGRYHHCGIWRPEYDCRMNNLGVAWCSVCSLRIGNTLFWATVLDTSGCFVAGAVYGDAHHPDAAALRRWRDHHLQPGAPGRTAMRILASLYRRAGPVFADHIRGRPAPTHILQHFVFGPLAAMVTSEEDPPWC
jgi:hypothetical protein